MITGCVHKVITDNPSIPINFEEELKIVSKDVFFFNRKIVESKGSLSSESELLYAVES